jgi:gamma-glutamyltranspeptidase
MKKGGNTFDAMVATEALAVAYPFAGNIGGAVLWCIEKQTEKWFFGLPRKSAISCY